MKKISLSFLLTFLLLGILATAAMAQDGPRPNANQTGQGETFQELIKTIGMYGYQYDDNFTTLNNNLEGPKDQKVHGAYQNNTNSCASCHQTHAGSARQMLFTSASNVCMACHDGTLGFYDVQATGKGYFNSSSTAGTFGGDSEWNASAHNVFGGINHRAAQGGNPAGTGNTSWGATFTCASCHAPHGSHSDRLLHYNPNNMANTPVDDGGKKQMGIPITNSQVSGFHVRVSGTELKLFNGANPVNTPWLNIGWVFRPTTGSNNNGLTVDFRNAVARASSTEIAQTYVGGTADIPVTYQVRLAKDNSYDSPISNVDWKHDVVATMNNTTNLGNYSDFCASCHTDYVKGRGTSTFDPSKSLFGHTARNSSNGGRSCLGCHFAHGNDIDMMLDAHGRTVFELQEQKDWSLTQARNYIQDVNPSSALKKYTNMTSCFACHNSSRSAFFVNQTPSAEQPTGWSNVNDPSRKSFD